MLEEKIKSFGECYDLTMSAYRDTKDIGQRRYLLKKAEEIAVTWWDFLDVGDSIICLISDKKWAKSVYRKGEESTTEFYGLSNIARSVFENAKDKKWGKEIYDRIAPLAESFQDFYTLACFYGCRLKDKEKGRALCVKALSKAELCADYYKLGDVVWEQLKDREWAESLFREAEVKAVTNEDFLIIAHRISDVSKVVKKRFRQCIRGYDKTEVDQYVRVLHDTVKKLEEMYIEKASSGKKRPQILSLNAACDSVPDNVRGTDMLIIRFDSGIEDHYVYLGQIAGMVFSDEVRFSVAVCVGSEPPDDILLKCFDKVISVSSEVEAEQAVKTLIGDYGRQSFEASE